VRTFAAEAAQLGPRQAIANRLVEDRVLPGFGHMLYPDGDPRAAALLERFTPPPDLQALREAVLAVTGLAPNVDFTLVAGCEALRLPPDAPFALFSVARCAGWIAHAIEQGQTGALIRPRARYVGPDPDFG
jgi:citrate synthase